MSNLKVTLIEESKLMHKNGRSFGCWCNKNITGLIEINPAYPRKNVKIDFDYVNGSDVTEASESIVRAYLDGLKEELLEKVKSTLWEVCFSKENRTTLELEAEKSIEYLTKPQGGRDE